MLNVYFLVILYRDWANHLATYHGGFQVKRYINAYLHR